MREEDEECLGGDVAKAIKKLEQDGIPRRPLWDHLAEVLVALADQIDAKRAREAAQGRHTRIKGFARELQRVLDAWKGPCYLRQTLDRDWLMDQFFPTEKAIDLRVSAIPQLLDAVADLFPENDPKPEAGPDYSDFAEADLMDFVRRKSESGAPHFQEVSDALNALVQLAFPHGEVTRRYEVDALKMRDYRRRAMEKEKMKLVASGTPAESAEIVEAVRKLAAERFGKSRE